MAWIVVDKNGEEYVYEIEPIKKETLKHWGCGGEYVNLPQGSIKKLIGRDLTWEDEPVELKKTKLTCQNQ